MSASTDTKHETGRGLKLIGPGALWLGLAVLAAVLFYRGGIADLWANWQTPEYSHGPLIPLISGYLFLRQMKSVPAHHGPVTDRWPGLMVLGLALLVGLFGTLTQIQKFVSVALIIWVFGMILVSFGWGRGKQFWPPVVHLAFMIPLPFWIHWKVSIFLQGVSSELGVALIQAMGIPVFLDGHIIDLGTYKLHVAEACSGLRYMFPIMSFTYIFAVLYQGSIWHKVILLMAAVPIAILMNSFRIGVIGIMVDNYGIEHAEGFLHFFEGWVVFLLCILAMLVLARVMQRLSGDRRPFSEVLDVDTEGLGEQLARVNDVQPSRALIGSAAVFGLAALIYSPLAGHEPKTIEREPFYSFPTDIGDWRTNFRSELDPQIADILAADDYLSVSMASRAHRAPVDLFIAWYRDQNGGGIHSPEVCLPAGGWEMSNIEQVPVDVSLEGRDTPLTIHVNRAVIQKGVDQQLVYYWFDQAGRRTASSYASKLYLLYDGVQTGRSDGALVRLITPIGKGEPIENAEARLRDMMGDTLPLLPKFIGTTL
ncbi:MAG: VPLPA-CTERM-specific exosortase XrtD [Pseudomonadota bacterium]